MCVFGGSHVNTPREVRHWRIACTQATLSQVPLVMAWFPGPGQNSKGTEGIHPSGGFLPNAFTEDIPLSHCVNKCLLMLL